VIDRFNFFDNVKLSLTGRHQINWVAETRNLLKQVVIMLKQFGPVLPELVHFNVLFVSAWGIYSQAI
jgi:hypothetical protein